MRKFLVSTAALMLLTTAANAGSQSIELATSGYWHSWYIAQNNSGVPMCGMATDLTNASVMVKWTPDGDKLFVQVFKASWQIPEGVEMPVTLTFDGGDPWVVQAARGARVADSANYLIDFGIRKDQSLAFVKALSSAKQLHLFFTQGSEPPWTISLYGSETVAASFAKCVTDVWNKFGTKTQPTQPFANPVPTQPFKGTPATPTTQPFANGRSGV